MNIYLMNIYLFNTCETTLYKAFKRRPSLVHAQNYSVFNVYSEYLTVLNTY